MYYTDINILVVEIIAKSYRDHLIKAYCISLHGSIIALKKVSVDIQNKM